MFLPEEFSLLSYYHLPRALNARGQGKESFFSIGCCTGSWGPVSHQDSRMGYFLKYKRDLKNGQPRKGDMFLPHIPRNTHVITPSSIKVEGEGAYIPLIMNLSISRRRDKPVFHTMEY